LQVIALYYCRAASDIGAVYAAAVLTAAHVDRTTPHKLLFNSKERIPMKVRIIAIAIVSLALSAARGNQILDFLEIGEGHFAVLLNNHPWPHVTISTSGDFYNITLDEGYSYNNSFPVEIDEPDAKSVFDHGIKIGILTNFIQAFEGERSMTWDSEGFTPAGRSHNNPSTVMGGVMGPNGEMFDVRVFDVPEPSSTISIFGIGLAGLAWFARFRKAAR
jgi:hypothetical protein